MKAEQIVNVKRNLLYQSDNVSLEQIIWANKKIWYREVINTGTSLQVEDYTELPLWYIRWKKLNELGID
jgi:hypothetical protein